MDKPVTRRIVLGVGISLDGYIARPDGAVDFLFMPKDYPMASFMATIDTAIMGRKTWEVALQMGGESYHGSSTATYVFAHTPQPAHKGVTFISQSPAEFITGLRKKPGKDIWLMGGGELARSFLEADLVDQLYLGIVPVLLGEGLPLFPSGFPQRDFSLLDNQTYSKGLIALKYERAPKKRERRANRR